MKNNEKVSVYMTFFQLFFKKSTHPACKILKPYLFYIRSVWECKKGAGCVLRLFLSFFDLGYRFERMGA